MNHQAQRESVRIERLAAETQEQTLVEGEVALPGGIREEATILATDARLVLLPPATGNERLSVDGSVVFQVLYQQGDDTVRVLEANCSFTHAVPCQGVDDSMTAKAWGNVRTASATAVSGRLRLSAGIDIGLSVFQTESISVIGTFPDVDTLQTRYETRTVLRHAAEGSGSCLVREEFEIGSTQPVQETLFMRANPRVTSTTAREGKAYVEGDVLLEVFHQGADPAQPLVVTRHHVPFAHAVTLSAEATGPLQVTVQVEDAVASSVDVGEGHRILRTETVLDLSVSSFETQTLRVLSDAYTLSGDTLALTHRDMACLADVQRYEGVESDKLVISLPEDVPAIASVLSILATPTPLDVDSVGGRSIVEGVLDIQMVYKPENGQTAKSVSRSQPFRIAYPGTLPTNARIALTIQELQGDALSSDRAEIKYNMALTAEGSTFTTVHLPVDASFAPSEEESRGILAVWSNPGETLWDIGKRLRVTREGIEAMNPGVEPTTGKGILVFKR